MARKHPDRPLYVTVPRDLDKQPAFMALSRDAQWLLQHLERDSYRLGCGVFVLNPAMIAKAAKATTDDIAEWLAELIANEWVLHDDTTGEVWMTQHMEWDFTLASPNQAKGVIRDLKRVHSERMCRLITALVVARYPSLREGDDIDPRWDEEPLPEHPPGGGAEGPSGEHEGHPSGEVAGTPKHQHEAQAQSTKPGANSTEHGARSTQPQHEARSTSTDGACRTCDGLGLFTPPNGSPRSCTCAEGLKAERHLRAVGDS